jgi:PAS domain S-box-containing protein
MSERDALRALAALSANDKEGPFRLLTQFAARALGVDYSFLCECTDASRTRVRMLAFWQNDHWAEPTEYGVEGTPCREVIGGEVCFHPSGIQALYPDDSDLVDLGAEGYLGVPLRDPSNEVIGHLAVLDRVALPDRLHKQELLAILADRAAAELSRLRAERVRDATLERFRTFAENAHDVIAEVDPAGNVIYMNGRSREVLGLEPEECLGPVRFDLAHSADVEAQRDSFHKALESEHASTAVVRSQHTDGSWRWIEWHVRSFETAMGETHFVATGRDQTQRLQLEEERRNHAEQLEFQVRTRTAELERANQRLRTLQADLIAARGLEASENLAASIAHAVNNPLTALIGTVQIGLAEQPGDRRLQRVHSLASRLERTVGQMLRLHRGDTLERSATDLEAMLSELLTDLMPACAECGIEVRSRVASNARSLRADPVLLGEALASIARNAVEAMTSGGVLTIEAELFSEIDVISIRVADTGSGIPDSLRDEVLKPFFTTRATGTGLGLAIANGVVRGHGGRIHIGERPGGGTVVTVDLPRDGEPASPRT